MTGRGGIPMRERVPKLSTARTSEQILAAAAAYARHARDPGATGPVDTPGADELAEWCAREAGRAGPAANRLLAETLGEDRWQWGMVAWPGITFDSGPLCAALPIAELFDADQAAHYTLYQARPLELVHQGWLEHHLRPRPVHPLLPLVAAWQERVRVSEPFRPRGLASVPRFHLIPSDEASLLTTLPAGIVTPDTVRGVLPRFESHHTSPCPSWLLWAFSAAGGRGLSEGRVAASALHLFFGVLLHLGIAQRDGYWHALRFPLDYVVRWFYPDGWINIRRDWDRFPAALHYLRQHFTHVPVGDYDVAVLIPTKIPRTPTAREVEFFGRVPPSARSGIRLDWPQLCLYATQRESTYRAYLAAVAFLDRSAHEGHPITAKVGAPILKDGRRVRRKGGVLVRDPSQLIPNPQARFVPWLKVADLAQMIGFDSTNRFRRRDAREAFERLHADKVVDLYSEGKGKSKRFRIFGPPVSNRSKKS